MSLDFFTALIGRHAGTARTVEPRIGSRYEDTQAGGLPPFERFVHPAARGRTGAEPEPRMDAEVAAATSPAPAYRTENAPRRPARGTAPDSPTGESRDRPAVIIRAATFPTDARDRLSPAPPTDSQRRYDASLRMEALLSHLNALAHSQGSQPNKDRSLSGARLETRPSAGREKRANAGYGATQAISPERLPGDSSLSGQVSPEPARSAAGPAPQDWMAALQDKLSRRRGPPERASEPVINVTIGRVEVKAVRETGPAASPHKKAPAIMTLDDYLARRERGS